MHGSDADFNGIIAGPGGLGLSIIIDPPNATYNFTSVSFTVTEFVTVVGCDFNNMTTGFKTTTGKPISLRGNRWHDFPGHDTTSPAGILIGYDATNGVGVPPQHIQIRGDIITNMGSVQPGYGLLAAW